MINLVIAAALAVTTIQPCAGLEQHWTSASLDLADSYAESIRDDSASRATRDAGWRQAKPSIDVRFLMQAAHYLIPCTVPDKPTFMRPGTLDAALELGVFRAYMSKIVRGCRNCPFRCPM